MKGKRSLLSRMLENKQFKKMFETEKRKLEDEYQIDKSVKALKKTKISKFSLKKKSSDKP